MLIKEQDDLITVKIKDKFAAAGFQDHKRFLNLLKQYGKFENVPDDITFTSYGFNKIVDGKYSSDKTFMKDLKLMS